MEDLTKIDLYELLQIEITATEKEIKTAYRKKALQCHPDKNPDNPKAAELFQQLAKALEILTDDAARSAYNRVLKARKETELRNRLLDSKRRKLKEDLEAREKAAKSSYEVKVDAALDLAKEIDRLRKEGSKQLKEEEMLMKQHIAEEFKKFKAGEYEKPRFKLTWKAAKNDPNNGGYNEEELNRIFSKYGEVTFLIVGKKGGSALIEFASTYCAANAYECENGLKENPLNLTWLQGKPNTPVVTPVITQPRNIPKCETVITETDYESLVLTRLRQAQERQKIIQEMKNEGN